MDPTCRSCGGYPCDCGKAIGVPILMDGALYMRNFSTMALEPYTPPDPEEEKRKREEQEAERRRAHAKRKEDTLNRMRTEEVPSTDVTELSRVLLYAASVNDLELVTKMLRLGAEKDVQMKWGAIHIDPVSTGTYSELCFDGSLKTSTPLLFACVKNNLAMVEEILKYKPNVNANGGGNGNTAQFTPLHWAALHENEAMIDALLANGADKKIDDGWGKYPWQHVKNNKDLRWKLNFLKS